MLLLHYNSSRPISDEILMYGCYSVILLTVFFAPETERGSHEPTPLRNSIGHCFVLDLLAILKNKDLYAIN
jgi:hypothetical protein